MRFSRSLCALICLIQPAADCSQPQAASAEISIQISADGQKKEYSLAPGSTVEKTLQLAGVKPESHDRTVPSDLAILNDGDEIQVIRVTESFEVQQETIPLKSQVLKNEVLPQDEEYLVQGGKNGLKEIIYHRVFENGIDITWQPVTVKTVILDLPLSNAIQVTSDQLITRLIWTIPNILSSGS